MGNKEVKKIKKLDLPDVINNDLTYYMQFGWKRLNDRVDKRKESVKYSVNVYRDTFSNHEHLNKYSENN
mgnify:CR=1 FL=1